MTIEHHDHITGMCEAITGQDGNELNDLEVTINYCNKPPAVRVKFTLRDYLACDVHARQWQDRFSVEMLPLEDLE